MHENNSSQEQIHLATGGKTGEPEPVGRDPVASKQTVGDRFRDSGEYCCYLALTHNLVLGNYSPQQTLVVQASITKVGVIKSIRYLPTTL